MISISRQRSSAKKSLAFLLLLFIQFSLSASENSSNTLWYEQPAADWTAVLPIGTGRMGALVYGGSDTEKIAISEETVWSGEPRDYTNEGAYKYLPELRKLILEDKYQEAIDFGKAHSLGVPVKQAGFQALGDLYLHFPGHEKPVNYRRSLNMADGIVRVQYSVGDATYEREVFASYPDQIIAVSISSDKKAKLTFSASLSSLHEDYSVSNSEDNMLVLSGKSDAIKFCTQLKVRYTGGRVSFKDGKLDVVDADSVVLLLSAATNYVKYDDISADPEKRCVEYLDGVAGVSYCDLKKKHVSDFESLFNRVDLDLGSDPTELAIPTDKLLEQVIGGKHSALLEAQIFQFGRYLSISGARPGTMPLNLVGIWPVDGLKAPWGGKWTLNINAELNTWPAETTALPECHEPLLALLEDLRETGRRVAREHYDCRGFVAHHNTDLWRGAAPVDTSMHGLWTMGAAWLTRHLWEHYDFSRDLDFLRKAYPTMKEAALFFEDFLIKGPDGYLATCPAISFEQTLTKPNGELGRLTYAPTMDNQILRDLFTNCISAAEVLGIDSEKRDLWIELKSQLRPNQIDPDTGRIMEWAFQAEQKPVSGQLAPIWGASPGREINIHDTPEIAQACIRFLEHVMPRVPAYQSAGSWITGTHLNAWARLENPGEAYRVLTKAVRERTSPNFMMVFYKKNYFEIDGNMGYTAGIAEMLLQSHRTNDEGEPILHLLPALPKQWNSGEVKGLRARGAFIVDLKWENGKLIKAIITSQQKKAPLNLYYAGKSISHELKAGESFVFVP